MNKAAKAAPRASPPAPPAVAPREKLFALAAGLWLGISFIKFGNPVIFDTMVVPPSDLAQFVFTAWPVAWGYALLAGVLLLGIGSARPRFTRGHWPIAALGVWMFWQFVSNTRSVEPKLSNPVLVHFVACVLALLLGWWALARVRAEQYFWIPVLLGFTYTLVSGFDQHYGGLEATREEFYKQPNWQMYPKEFLLKMQSTRIFSTLIYPNAFAGLILLLFPICLWKFSVMTSLWPRIARRVALGLFGYMSACCLFWTGSKGGWLVALLMLLVLILHLKLDRRFKTAILAGSLVVGLAFFFLRFSGYFQRGATSVSARFIYWQAAAKTALDNPIFGTGPGTFSVPFSRIKPADAEMAKLTHNDYLEQASDSGVLGALTYAAFVFGSLVLLYRQRPAGNWSFFLIWLGVFGWAVQAFIEFGLYIPALAWPTFLLIGILWGQSEKKHDTGFL